MFLQLLINGICLGAVYALIAVGFAIVFSVLKFSNFAHGGMISACAFLGYFFQASFETPPPIWVTIIFSSVSGVIFALFLDTIAYRSIRRNKSPNIYYFLASLTISIIITSILNIFFSKNPLAYPALFSSTTFSVGSLKISKMDTMILAVSVVLLVALMLLINKTKIGLAIRAVAINPETSKIMGINSSLIIIMVFSIAGCLAGVSGVLLGCKYGVYPDLGQTMMMVCYGMVFNGVIASGLAKHPGLTSQMMNKIVSAAQAKTLPASSLAPLREILRSSMRGIYLLSLAALLLSLVFNHIYKGQKKR